MKKLICFQAMIYAECCFIKMIKKKISKQYAKFKSIKILNKVQIPCHMAGSGHRHRDLPEIFRKQKNERPRSCSNLIKKFLHGSAAHSATPSCPDLTSVHLSLSLSPPLSLSLSLSRPRHV